MDGSTPFELLKAVDESIKKHEFNDAMPEYQDAWRGIHFRVGELSLLAPILQVREVIHPTQLLTLPRIKRWVKGVIQLRGELVLINDLSDFLLNSPTDIDLKGRVLVIEHQHEKVGFLVPHIYRILALKAPKVQSWENPLQCDYLKQAFKVENQLCPVLDFHKLLQDSKFLQTNII